MRLQSLDAFRGLSTLLMIFVDQTGRFFPETIGHSAWNGIHLADIVMPAFLFIVGCSVGVVSRRASSQRTPTLGKLRKVCNRTVKLFLLGLVTQGASLRDLFFDGYDLETLRICGILQRIALVYCIVASLEAFVAHPVSSSSSLDQSTIVVRDSSAASVRNLTEIEEKDEEDRCEEMREGLLRGRESAGGRGVDSWSEGVEEMKRSVARRTVQWVFMVANVAMFTVVTFAMPVGEFAYEDASRNISVVVACHGATLDPVSRLKRSGLQLTARGAVVEIGTKGWTRR